MEIPDSVLIGGRRYRVEKDCKGFGILVDFINAFSFKDTIGMINYSSRTIKLRGKRTKLQKEKIFFHELAHGIAMSLGNRYTKMKELNDNERFIDAMGAQLRKAFIDMEKKQVK